MHSFFEREKEKMERLLKLTTKDTISSVRTMANSKKSVTDYWLDPGGKLIDWQDDITMRSRHDLHTTLVLAYCDQDTVLICRKSDTQTHTFFLCLLP